VLSSIDYQNQLINRKRIELGADPMTSLALEPPHWIKQYELVSAEMQYLLERQQELIAQTRLDYEKELSDRRELAEERA
jgi:hypothetical protein